MSEITAPLPYRVRPEFLTPPEKAFYHVLYNLVREDYFVCVKVALTDLIFVARPNENVQYANKLIRKNVDYLLINAATLDPALGIELDYPRQSDHRSGESLLDGIFKAAGLPLLHVTMQQTYSLEALSRQLKTALASANGAGQPAHTDFSPICPRCGITMVLRFDKDGPHLGQKYYGCLNFPECQETVDVKVSR